MKYGILWRIKTFCRLLSDGFVIAFIFIPLVATSIKSFSDPRDRIICRLLYKELRTDKQHISEGLKNVFSRNSGEWYDEWVYERHQELDSVNYLIDMLLSE